MKQETLEAAARSAHECNRAFSMAHGAKDLPHWEQVSEETKKIAYKGVLRVVAGASARELFETWARDKFEAGWRWAPERDDARKLHPNICEWENLPPVERCKDELFAGVVRAVLLAFPLSSLSERPAPKPERSRRP